MSAFEDVKHVDVSIKDTVNGYLRRLQQLLASDTIYYSNIPCLVSYWCLLFYYIKECFDVAKSDPHSSYSKDATLAIKNSGGSPGCIFLTQVVNQGVHKWKFKLIAIQNYAVTIGVWKGDKTDNTHRISADAFSQSRCYAYIVNHCICTPGDSSGRRYGYGTKNCQSGDQIEMILDLNKHQLSYSVNDTALGIAFKDIQQTCYRAVLSIWKTGDAVELMSYSCDYRHVKDQE